MGATLFPAVLLLILACSNGVLVGFYFIQKKKKEDIFPCLVIKNKISYKLTQLNDFSSVLESYKKLLISHDGIIKENILFKIN